MTDISKPHGFAGKMLVVLAASIVLILAVLSLDRGDLSSHEGYAVAVGAIAGVIALIMLILHWVQPGTLSKHCVNAGSTSLDVKAVTAAFLCLWWLIGTSVITFKAPFPITGNGYFAAWVGLLASAMALGECTSMSFPSDKARGAIVGLLVSAIVIIVAIAILHDDEHRRKHMDDESIFGLVSACFTCVVCLIMLVFSSKVPDIAFKIMAILLLLLWIATAGVLTFRSPFIYTGNGYFACWAGLLFSIMIFSASHVADHIPRDLETGGEQKPAAATTTTNA